MTLPQVYRLFAYWDISPPEHELVALMARCFTTWEPKPSEEKAPEQKLEDQWRQGAMNAADLLAQYEKTGGVVDALPRG